MKNLGQLIAHLHATALGKAGSRLMLAAFVLFSAFNMGERCWNTFDPLVANDGLTPIYAQYARNLVRYPFSETLGLMVDLVGDPPDSLTQGEPRTVYTDHPSGTVWLIAAINRFLIDDPVVAARTMNIIAAIGAAVIMLAFIYRRTSLLPSIGATVVLLTLPLFWEHSIVANFEPATLFFDVASAISFVGYLNRPSYLRLAATALLWVGGMLCDWPAYFLGGPIAAALVYRRQWGLLVLFTTLGFATMATVFGHMMMGSSGFSPMGFFIGTRGALLTEPFAVSLDRTFGNIVRGFAPWRWWLVLPFVPIVWRGELSGPLKELRFLFLSFLFVGVANDLTFYSWAGEHSFWSYYLIPAACCGAALTIQWLSERTFKLSHFDLVFRAVIMVLFAVSGVSSAKATLKLIKPHFSNPPSVADMLGERHLGDLLAPKPSF